MGQWKFKSGVRDGCAHMCLPNGMTVCQIEKPEAFKRKQHPDIFFHDFQTVDEQPLGRPVCSNCVKKSKTKGKKRRKAEKFYQSWAWAEMRFAVLKRYGSKCMCCGGTKRIVVDHIKPRSRYPELELEFDNLQILCDMCNKGKSNKDETDFRTKADQRTYVQSVCDDVLEALH